MFLEVLAIVYLVSSTDGKVDDQPTSGTPVISYIVKENRAHKVPGHPGSSCGLEPNPTHGSSECLIACLTHNNKKTLYGFGWNKNTLACRCCKKSHPSRSDIDEGWETYLPGCFDNFSTVFHGGTPRCLHNMYQQREMSYSEAMSECENLGGVLVQSTSTTDLEWMKALVNFIGNMDSGGFQVVDDDTLKPFLCEKEPVFEMWN